MLSGAYTYDVLFGLGIVAFVFLLPVLLFVTASTIRMLSLLKRQDELLVRNVHTDFSNEILLIIKRGIFAIVGYKGEEREKLQLVDLDASWIWRYKISIFFRFFLVYFVYIALLVLNGRPIDFSINPIGPYQYISDVQALVLILLIYVVSNVLFDLLSLFFTIKHLAKMLDTGKIVKYSVIDACFGVGLLLVSQIVSCILWVVKRAQHDFPTDTNLLFLFADITLWPYSFVRNIQEGELIGQLLPGQLLITGTVIIPTLFIVFIAVTFVLTLRGSWYIKKILMKINMDELCYKYLKILTIHHDTLSFRGNYGYCNVVIVLGLNSFLWSTFYAMFASIFM